MEHIPDSFEQIQNKITLFQKKNWLIFSNFFPFLATFNATEGCQGEIGFPKIQLFFLIRVYLLSKPTKINDFWIFGHIWLKKISIL
jgi:hypothetical protein